MIRLMTQMATGLAILSSAIWARIRTTLIVMTTG